MKAHLPLCVNQHLDTSIYLQINSTHIPKEASKKFHTFVRLPIGPNGHKEGKEEGGLWGTGGGGRAWGAIKRSQMKW